MKINKLGFLALLACAFGASANPVGEMDATRAARGWVSWRQQRGANFGSSDVESSAVHTTTNGATFYTVKMVGGGTVFLSGDDELQPVVGFTSESVDLSTLDPKSPLWALLNRDFSVLKDMLDARAATPAGGRPVLSTSSVSSPSPTAAMNAENGARWARLINEGLRVESGKSHLSTSAAVRNPSAITDMRVPSLVPSKWGQGAVGGVGCYNYYTPNGTDPAAFKPGSADNAVCGCVATALSQIMRYFRYPTQPMTPFEKRCAWKGTPMYLITQGGTYDWDMMPAEPAAGGLTEDQRKAIGKITSDAGIAMGMDYSPEESGSVGAEAGDALVGFFDYKNATAFFDEHTILAAGGANRLASLGRCMFCNFDAGLPVYVAVPGHAIFADGYGFIDDVDYVHFNMGWSGSRDYWYNIPDLTEAAETFTRIDTVVYNIFTNATPEHAVISGRVTDDDLVPLADVDITIYNSNGGDVVHTTKTNERGIWYAIVEAGKYDVVAEQDRLVAEISDIELAAPSVERGYVYARKPEDLGNSWGNDMILAEPTVRIGEHVFTTLDKALRTVQAGDRVEVILPTLVKKPVTVVSNCYIVATNDDARASAVGRLNASMITVAPDVTVVVSNLVFDVEEGDKTIRVDLGGVLRIDGFCDLMAVETSDDAGLLVNTELSYPIWVDCTNTAAMAEGALFARSALDYETSERCAYMLLHYSNTRLGGAVTGGRPDFVWSRDAPVPDAAAVGRTVIGGTSRNYRSANDIFEDIDAVSDDVEILFFGGFKPKPLDRNLDLSGRRLVMRGATDERLVLVPSNSTGRDGFGKTRFTFNLGVGGSLTISNLIFRSSIRPSSVLGTYKFIDVNGGELTLQGGAELDGIVGCSDRASGVIDLLSGTVTMNAGSVISNCVAHGVNGHGGAIYVHSSDGCALNLLGGRICACRSQSFGGGVFVYANAWSEPASTVRLGGELTVYGNFSGDTSTRPTPDDIYLPSLFNLPKFILIDQVRGNVGVLYAGGLGCGNDRGDPFATVDGGLSPDEDTLLSFFSDAHVESDEPLCAALGIGDKSGTLVWTDDTRDERQCPESEAAAVLIAPDGRRTYWSYVSDALSNATDGCTVELLREGAQLTGKVSVAGTGVTFRSPESAAAPLKLYRAVDAAVVVPAGCGLTVTNLDIYGYSEPDLAQVKWSTNALFSVSGGSLRMLASRISQVAGIGARDANAVTVYDRGDFVMDCGSQILDSANRYRDPTLVKETEDGATGGLLVDNATASLRDAVISGCAGYKGGGVFACNGSELCVSNHLCVIDNTAVGTGDASNLVLSDNSRLMLDGELTGVICSHPGYRASTSLVARVSSDWDWSVNALTNSAAGFKHDLTDESAVAVTNGTTALIVWCGAVRDGSYLDEETGLAYALVGEIPAETSPLPASRLPELGTLSVASVLAAADLADPSVAARITSPDDYNSFRNWALRLGVDRVANSSRAGISYALGASELVDDPSIEISDVTAVEGGLSVRVTVRDGGSEITVAADRIRQMFEATSDLGDWQGHRVELSIDAVRQIDGTIRFVVRPADTSANAFIRLRY